jgi:hypothetical protein
VKQRLPAPDSPDRQALLHRVAESRWLRFGVGADASGPMPADDEGVRLAALEFAANYELWCGYRDSVIEISPRGGPSVRFRISPPSSAAGPAKPAVLPAATLAVITAWNPGSGEPRPNERANRRANLRLAAHLDARLCERWTSVSAPGTRFAEEGFAVLGLSLDEAWRIAEGFQQRAIYYVDQGRPLLAARRRGQVVTWEGQLVSA